MNIEHYHSNNKNKYDDLIVVLSIKFLIIKFILHKILQPDIKYAILLNF
jgi:hypothetical protein